MVVNIAERIKEAREKNALTQNQLANKLSLTRASVNAWEMGISAPSTENLAELAIALNVSTDYILGIENAETVSVEGLTNEEKRIVYELINVFKNNK